MIEEKIDYRGNDIKQGGVKVVENQQACANLAVANEKAKFWTYNTMNKKCYIKTAKAGEKSQKMVYLVIENVVV